VVDDYSRYAYVFFLDEKGGHLVLFEILS
jgi:hypothetical protein